MPKKPYELNDPILVKQWSSINQKSQECISIQRVQQWIPNVLNQSKGKKNSLENRDINQLIICYLTECQLEGEVSEFQFKYQQAVNFLNWLADRLDQEQQHQEEQDNEMQLTVENHKQEQIKEKFHFQQQENQFNNSSSHSRKHQGEQEEGKIKKDKARQYKNEEQLGLKDQNLHQKQRKSYNHQYQNESSQNQQKNEQGSINIVLENHKNDSQKKKKQPIWKENLQIIFQHYCKISYALRQDPTFEQIQQKTQSMTVNKFMIFCRDFGISNLRNINRNILVDLFKKNSELLRHMTLPQFCLVMEKIAPISYPDTTTQQSLNALLKYLQINSSSAFSSKMKKMKINYNKKGAKALSKKLPSNYQFKFTPNDQPYQTNNNSENGLKNKQNKFINKLQERLLKLKPVKNHKIVKQSTNIINLPQNTKLEKVLIPNPKYSSFSNNNTGYYNIHMLKNSKIQSNDTYNRLRLNSIVEDAKKIVKENLHQQYQGQIHQNKKNSFQTRKRQLSQSNNIQTSYESEKVQLFGRVSKNRGQSFQQISRLLQDQDEDEYLQEHLSREKKNNQIYKRIQKRIQELQN